MAKPIDPTPIHGHVAPGFEAVRAAFADNFAERGEVGAACAAYHHGRKVVDLWGGYRHARRRTPWQEDTLVLVFSMSKGLAAMTLAVAHSRGWLDYDEQVAVYWPEFGQQGKEAITVRQLLAHQAGLCVVDEPLSLDTLADPEALSAALARQKPAWDPGSRHGYHALSLGWYEGQLLRRVDPQGRSLGRFFQEEIAQPLGIEFYIGLPPEVPGDRLATMHLFRASALLHLDPASRPFLKASLNPRSLAFRAFTNPRPTLRNLNFVNNRDFLALENPAFTGVGQVRAVACAYSALATGGQALGLRPETLAALAAPPAPPPAGLRDEVLQTDTSFSLGFLRPFPGFRFGSSQRAYGVPGAGGSMAYADPDARASFAYAPNRMGLALFHDARQLALREAFDACLASATNTHHEDDR
jgi:CubicO group peptidase (beta-lactamase class C family)